MIPPPTMAISASARSGAVAVEPRVERLRLIRLAGRAAARARKGAARWGASGGRLVKGCTARRGTPVMRAMAAAISRRHSLPWQGPVPKPV